MNPPDRLSFMVDGENEADLRRRAADCIAEVVDDVSAWTVYLDITPLIQEVGGHVVTWEARVEAYKAARRPGARDLPRA